MLKNEGGRKRPPFLVHWGRFFLAHGILVNELLYARAKENRPQCQLQKNS